jgi:adenine-specific DNA-methyltransferase
VSAVGAFLATATADRVLRCINASVAVSASELEAMPLPAAGEVVAALASPDPEAAIARLYGAGE